MGRHNALDKLIGAMVKAETNPGQGFVIVTSRASFEMVQKCATVGVSFMAAISAPTGLAIRLAEETGVLPCWVLPEESVTPFMRTRKD